MNPAVNTNAELKADVPLTPEETKRKQKLNEKKNKSMFEAAFCGHFSAGKSTLLNRITGAEVLPTSPIPTSANIISIRNGDPGLTVYSEDGGEKAWDGEIPWPKVREWGMDGAEITGMTLTAPLPFLGSHSVILDTPGVDSTDDDHKKVTVEQLYTTDLIVYVMDYNHVQSETNLQFLKQCSIEKKPIILVINQIDKHNENELKIGEFRQSLNDVLTQWDISVLALYFTSMKDMDHPLNEYAAFEKSFKALVYNSESLLDTSALRLAKGFYQSVDQRLEEEKLEEIQGIRDELVERGFSFSMLEEKGTLEAEAERLKQPEKIMLEDFHDTFRRTFENITLFPYTATDLALKYIESVKPGFKTGILPSRRKKEAEQQKRLTALADEVSDRGKTLVLYKVKDYLKQLEQSSLTNRQEVQEALADIDLPDLEALFRSNVNTGHTDEQYVRTFTSQMNKAVMKDVITQAEHFIRLYAKGMEKENDRKKEAVQQKLQSLGELAFYEEKYRAVEEDTAGLRTSVYEILNSMPADAELDRGFNEAMKKPFPEDQQQNWAVELPGAGVIDTADDHEEEVMPEFDEKKASARLNGIESTLRQFENSPVLESERLQLLNRIERYRDQTFMISLFGAFSAGKSSFANALLGRNVLPVSPNPTTATVNLVRKSTAENAHETALVYFKTREELEEEIKAVSKEIGESVNLESLSSWKRPAKKAETSRIRTYSHYLQTIKTSLAEEKHEPGSVQKVALDDLQVYVAEEKTACLVAKAEIFFDCPLTEKGLILVDTPGVNSIHGRHTNVAFRQMRESDAIFYLTYYNHAFSRADEYFLQQMGKVNESFSRDKLYFVINASDLASGKAELNGVKKHVSSQLERNGIQSPRIHTLSSRNGLKWKQGKLENEHSFSRFEDTFYSRTVLELKKLSCSIIEDELRGYTNRVRESIRFMNAEKEEQKKEQLRIQSITARCAERIEQSSFTSLRVDVEEQLDQLLIYLKQRMTYVFNDYFSTSFNVTTITGSSRRQLFARFSEAVSEWLSFGEQFLRQELEATSIRLEQRIQRRVEKWMEEEKESIRRELPHLSAESSISVGGIDTAIHAELQLSPEEYKDEVKSQKDFFENGRVKKVKETITAEAAANAARVIDMNSPRFRKSLAHEIFTAEQNVKSIFLESLEREKVRLEKLFDPAAREFLESELKSLEKL
ncbi:dynamin family protein [Alteribacter natronophilus]|uniref:dynamin family protein n=1 Tax=Alteribacter natronophilus TaxID=2583810 RepID=UPI00110E01FC|nr:dynamin family protein [Alteribacter natronophilus]TMW73431.1 hypothetical protein FGB90_03775 [Alteribacter natronophilus]